MGWAYQKAEPKIKIKFMHNFKLSTSPTYLSTSLIKYIVWTHLGQLMYLLT
jgi:hypothetical protein